MAVNIYECLFLIEPNKASSDWDNSMATANGMIERHGGEILFSRHWGEPKLAYPIKKFRKGGYLLTYFRSDSQGIPKMEADFRLAVDLILRHMVVKLHPSIADRILAQLHGTHSEEEGSGEEGAAEAAGEEGAKEETKQEAAETAKA
ncbi:30S ribosomal protein S6 [Planctomycetes bacterium Pan216]|uniref:Small ribosomal subunit protein bS6 n=1 Tax=Kolteria novifilia TaxID=2527975 RepID=A0A518B9W0_9BACT|nr:30S ribosomal protein S6 [Planctomycetes bacterium Pan216]